METMGVPVQSKKRFSSWKRAAATAHRTAVMTSQMVDPATEARKCMAPSKIHHTYARANRVVQQAVTASRSQTFCRRRRYSRRRTEEEDDERVEAVRRPGGIVKVVDEPGGETDLHDGEHRDEEEEEGVVAGHGCSAGISCGVVRCEKRWVVCSLENAALRRVLYTSAGTRMTRCAPVEVEFAYETEWWDLRWTHSTSEIGTSCIWHGNEIGFAPPSTLRL